MAIDQTTLSFKLAGPGGTRSPELTSYDSATRKATFTPTAALAASTGYTATLTAKSLLGVALAAPAVWSFTTAAPVVAPPTVSGQTPASGATGVALTTNVSGTFSKAITTGTLAFTLKTAAGAALAAAVTYNATTRVATLNPSADLAYGTTYTASLAANSTDGGVMTAPVTWSFTTPPVPVATVSGQTPAAGATGVALTSTVRGTFSIAITTSTLAFTVTGPSGAVAGAVTYNTTSRQATFTPSAQLAYGTTYTASLSATSSAGGAMPAPATWTFSTLPAPVPTVSGQTPANNATAVATTVKPAATFSIAITPATMVFTVKDAAGNTVPGSAAFNATSRVATFTPTAKLAYSTVYTASLQATGTTGGAMTSPVTWSFTTNPPFTSYSMFSATATPDTTVTTTAATTLGLKFSSTTAGSVFGVRYYAGTGNTANQPVALWNSAGTTMLASGTSTGSTTPGWRTVTFATPIAIAANTTFVVTYTATAGRYSTTSNDLLLAKSSGVLRTASGAGMIKAGTGFPSGTSTVNSWTNYWVDVVFGVPNA